MTSESCILNILCVENTCLIEQFRALDGSSKDLGFVSLSAMKIVYHTIIQAAFVCLFVCSPTPPRSFDGSSPNLVGVCRWTSELPLRGCFFKRSMGQTSLFRSRQHQAETTPLQKAHGVFCRARRLLPSKRHTASKSLIPSTGIFTSRFNLFIVVTSV